MKTEYNISQSSSNSQFRITDHVDFDPHGRALCPACSPNHQKNSKTLSIVPGTDGAYKCFRGCTPEEIRAVLGCPKPTIVPTALTKSNSKPEKKTTFDEKRVIQSHSELLSLNGASLDAIRWLANRGITTDLVKHYKLGISRVRSSGRMVYAISIPIPTYMGEEYYIKKRIAPWDKKVTEADDYKPWSQYGIPSTTYFTYKPEKASQTWLCEGEWDAILLGWLVQQHRNDVAVACFTCGCSSVPPEHEIDRLPGEVVVFYDRNDNLRKDGTRAGEEGAKKVAQALGERAKIAQVPMPENCTVKGWDVTDAIQNGYKLESFEQAVLEAKPYKKLEANSFLAKSRKLSQLFKEAPDYVDWLVPDLFTSNELYCLAAEPRAGKSLFALGLAKAVASGGKFLDRPCQQGEVVYICKEDPDDKVKERLIAQEWDNLEMENVLVNNDFTLDELPELAEYVREAKPSLIIFDTLSRIQTSNGRENSAEIADTLAPLQDLAQKENVCILVVHHTRKKNQDKIDILDIFDAVRGSGAIRATCRGMLVLTNSKNGYRLAVENGRTAVQDLEVYLNVANLTWKLKGFWTPPTVNLSQKDIVKDWFLKHQRGTIDQVYEGTLIPKRNIYQILSRLIADNVIKRKGKRRNTLYYLSIQQIQQVESLLNSPEADRTSDTGMNSTKVLNKKISDQSDQECNGLLRADHLLPDQQKKIDSVEFTGENASNPVADRLNAIQQNSTNNNSVDLNDGKVIKVIKENQITSDQFGDTTNFFDKKRSQESQEEEEKEKESLKGVWHKKEGYMVVIDQRGSKLTVRRSGEQKTQTIYLRGCDSRREYETYCTF